jgi:hypothetical protein
MSMHARTLLLFVALCCGTHANAESCSDRYDAIKSAAMYCDFFCDQRKLVPLQQAYEANCIVLAVPLSWFPLEERPDEPDFFADSEAIKPHANRRPIL